LICAIGAVPSSASIPISDIPKSVYLICDYPICVYLICDYPICDYLICDYPTAVGR